MPAPLVIAGAALLSKMQEKKAQEEAQRQALADLYQGRAAEMGTPTYHLNAMGAQKEIDEIEGPNYLGMLLDAEDQKRKASGDDEAELGGSDYFKLFSS